MDYNKVFKFDTDIFQIKDTEYKIKIEKFLRKLAKVLINDSFLGYESTFSHIEDFTTLLELHRSDFNKYYKQYIDEIKVIEKGFLFNPEGYTSDIEREILILVDKAKKILSEENYKSNIKCVKIFNEIESKLKSFILERELIDKRYRKNYQRKIALIRDLLDQNTFIALITVLSELNELNELKKENTIKYQNLYLRNINRYETIRDEFTKLKAFFSIKEKELLALQFQDIEKLLGSESYSKFDNASDILDQVEEKFKVAISGKKDRIIKYLETEVEGFLGYVWSEDLQFLREGVEDIVSKAKESNDFNNLNLDKFKIDERVNSKKSEIDDFVKFLIDSSSGIRREQKAKLSNVIKQAETFYRRDVAKKEFEEFTKRSKNILEGKISKTEVEEKKSNLVKLILAVVFMAPCIFLIFYNQSQVEEYNFIKGKKYLDYATKLATMTKKSGETISKNDIRKRIFVPKEDLKILTMTDSTIAIEYKGNILKGKF